MPKPASNAKKKLTKKMRDHVRSRAIFSVASLTILWVILLDRLSKIYFTSTLDVGETIPIIANRIHFTLVYNTGIAFGLLKGRNEILLIIPAFIIAAILIHLFISSRKGIAPPLYVFSFALIIGGAAGNLIDRFSYGYVIDFIDLRIWPVFNIADSCITIGTIILILLCIPSSAK